MEKIVLPIHFEDRSGIEFERLAFAYLSRTKDWNRIGWLGKLVVMEVETFGVIFQMSLTSGKGLMLPALALYRS